MNSPVEQTESTLQWRPMSEDDSLEYIDYVWRLVNPNATLAQPDDDGYEPIRPDESVAKLMAAVEAVLEREYDEEQAVVLNRIFGTSLDSSEWTPFLDARTDLAIRDLANRMTSHAQVPVVKPQPMAGMTSWEGGLFRIIVELLQDKGVDPKDIRPSTKLSGHLLNHADVFQWQVARLAPAQMPPTHHRYARWVEYAQITCVILTIAMILMCGPGFLYCTLTRTPVPLSIWFWIAGLVVFGGTSWLLTGVCKPQVATAGELQTFHDLCSALAVRYREGNGHSEAQEAASE